MSNRIFHIPVKWSETERFYKLDFHSDSYSKPRQFLFWSFFSLFPLINAAYQFSLMTQDNVSTALSRTAFTILKLFQAVILVGYLCSLFIMSTFMFKAEEFVALINDLRKFAFRERISESQRLNNFHITNIIESNQIYHFKMLKNVPIVFSAKLEGFRWRGLENYLIPAISFLCLILPFLFPIVALIWPCDHHLLTRLICSDSEQCHRGNDPCSGWTVVILLYSFEVFCCMIFFNNGGLIVTVSLLSLAQLIKCLKCIKYISRHPFLSISETHKLSRFYMKVQLLAQLINQALQFMFPLLQISGAGWTITCLYSSLQYEEHLPAVINAIVFLYGVVVIIVVGSLLDAASKTISFSDKILKPWKKRMSRRCEKYRNFQRVAKSLQIIKMHSGPFHVITRNKIAFFVRFCLHRTLFLVVRARTALH